MILVILGFKNMDFPFLGREVTGVTVFLEGRNSRRSIHLRAEICSCLLGGVFSEPGGC